MAFKLCYFYAKLTLQFPSFPPETARAQEREYVLECEFPSISTIFFLLMRKGHAHSVCTFNTMDFYCFNILILFPIEIPVTVIASVFYLLFYPTSNNQTQKSVLYLEQTKRKSVFHLVFFYLGLFSDTYRMKPFFFFFCFPLIMF